ncbi:protein involved in sex pheromone biosynthesis [Alkalihalobacillus xiaoxiensis]|uniref:Protein involved in sex pheromone biosynthesis n=1 Tax=Shouchella xiaoxiensis TaxID=766895 RepID=A0ABS2STZ9_9BACI|nr:CamS family sex pheromone protein [Shouchella xiaoxiensis]MBM7839018.1 protein involved in sex pheromone biosynthesis [Shouchella xiaoxiensis]
MKRWGIIGLSVIVLSGCGFFGGDEENDQTEGPDLPTSDDSLTVVPPVPSEENYYSSVLRDGAYVHGQSRGYGLDLGMSRSDLDWLELGLEDLAKEAFDPSEYYFQEGQHLTRDVLRDWIRRYDEDSNPQGLNPELASGSDMFEQIENSPWVLSNVLEHNYMQVDENGTYTTAGIVIGLSLYSEYAFTTDGRSGSVTLSDNVQEQEGMAFAEEIVSRIRNGVSSQDEDVSNVPIVVALFSEEPGSSLNAGHFFKQALFEPGEGASWEDISQKHITFPSSEASNEHQGDADRFAQLESDIQSFFSNYVGVVGRARYEQNQLAKLTVDVNIQYKGKAEVVAITQYIASRVEEHFEQIAVDVQVSSLSGTLESIVSYHPNADTFIHIVQ